MCYVSCASKHWFHFQPTTHQNPRLACPRVSTHTNTLSFQRDSRLPWRFRGAGVSPDVIASDGDEPEHAVKLLHMLNPKPKPCVCIFCPEPAATSRRERATEHWTHEPKPKTTGCTKCNCRPWLLMTRFSFWWRFSIRPLSITKSSQT